MIIDYLPWLYKIPLAIKTLSVDRFSKHLQVLLRQIDTYMLTKNILHALHQSKIISENSVSDVRFYTLNRYTISKSVSPESICIWASTDNWLSRSCKALCTEVKQTHICMVADRLFTTAFDQLFAHLCCFGK